MIRSLYTAATGMEAQQLNMDVTANNLANVNTTGFKKSRPDFRTFSTKRSASRARPRVKECSFRPACRWVLERGLRPCRRFSRRATFT